MIHTLAVYLLKLAHPNYEVLNVKGVGVAVFKKEEAQTLGLTLDAYHKA